MHRSSDLPAEYGRKMKALGKKWQDIKKDAGQMEALKLQAELCVKQLEVFSRP